MRIETTLAGFVLGGMYVMGTGCSSPTPDTLAPPFVDTTGQATAQAPIYPPPPYGLGIGTVIENFEFMGRMTPLAQPSTTELIRLSDFYNPHGKDSSYHPTEGEADDRYFAQDVGNAKAGQLKPTVLLIDIGSVWCGPCNAEANTDLPPKYALYAPCGGEFLLQLADGPTYGVPATEKNLRSWIDRYHVDYPSVIDPSYQLQPLFQVVAYPQNIVIDTTTMKIITVYGGQAVAGMCGDGTKTCSTDAECPGQTCHINELWTKYEAFLDKSRAGCALQ